MRLNKAKSQMYPFVDYTGNPEGGHCGHECGYCFMCPLKNRFEHIEEKYKGEPKLIEKVNETEPKNPKVRRRTSLSFIPEDNPLIFVCSANDPAFLSDEEKTRLLENLPRENYYLLQTKNPRSFLSVKDKIPPYVIFGTTIETDNWRITDEISNAPVPLLRAEYLKKVDPYFRFISIEPIMDFQVGNLVQIIKLAQPVDFVSIGANTRKDVDLPEPNAEKTRELIRRLSQFVGEVHIKPNLFRILEERESE